MVSSHKSWITPVSLSRRALFHLNSTNPANAAANTTHTTVVFALKMY
jgi:hypothetical protein